MPGISQLTMKQLRAFVAVYRSGKLATAAEALSVTTSAVSVLIRQIEASLGTRLFDRTTRALTPTAAAHEAIGIAERILQGVAQLEAGCRDLSAGRRGQVHFAVTPAVGSALMPATVRAFAREYPRIQVVIDDCAPDQFLARVLSEQVEFGVGTPESASADISTTTLLEDHLGVVCPADHPFARQGRVRWKDLESAQLIAIRPGYGIRRTVDGIAAREHVALDIVNEVNFIASLLWMVASGLGVAIVPTALVPAAEQASVVVRPLVAPKVKRSISIVTKRGRSLSPAAAAFTRLLRKTVGGGSTA